jgi:hypothetical protein
MRIDTPDQLEEIARNVNGTTLALHSVTQRNVLDPGRRNDKRPKIGNAAELQQRVFPEIPYIVPGIIAPGLTLFAGRPKIGKSWFCMDLLLAVSAGRYCLGNITCDGGNVLYLALEDNERRLRKRIAKLLPPNAEWPELFQYATQWPRANEGGVEAIRNWCSSVAKPRLIIVDVLAAFRSHRKGQQTPYEADYAALKELQQIASEFSVAIVVVHHTRKAGADNDRFDLVSGTTGLSAAADTTLILDRDAALGHRLYGRGRDIEEIDRVIEFKGESCRWYIRGEAAELRRSAERETLLTALADAGEPMSPADLVAATGMSNNNARQLLFKMFKSGEIEKQGRGQYMLPKSSQSGETMVTEQLALKGEQASD